MTTGENMMKLGDSGPVVSRLGIGAITWGDVSINPDLIQQDLIMVLPMVRRN